MKNPSEFGKEWDMKVVVTDACIGCERCVDICPEIFEMGDGIARVKSGPIPSEVEERVRQAAEECPVEAIVITE